MTDRIVTVSATIPAPPEALFEILASPRRHAEIDGSGTVKGATAGPERLTLGATFGMSMRRVAPYRITSKVVEFEEGRRIAWRHPLGHVWRYTFEPVEGGTRVTEEFDYSTSNAIGRAFVALGGYAEKNRAGMEQTLVRLGEAVATPA
jgi:uncharacterized protein YndB with AHSA1/START domain